MKDNESDNREIRVFISSTFRDMHSERELLVKKVFPELRRICDERFVSFTEVDLRWGITEEEAAEGKVLPICLEEIKNCRPYFIGMLGERYGWIPDTVPQEVLDKEPWIQEHVENKTSVTELEILHGVLNNPKMDGHAFFYFRNKAYATDRDADFSAESPDHETKLEALKETIRHSGRPLVDPYADPKALAAAVKQQFIELIDELYPKEEVPDPLDQEAIGHRTYARRKLLACINRPTHLAALNEFVESPSTGQGLVVTGDSGGGKTALLADFVSSFSPKPSSFVFEHYFGATNGSTSVPGFLHRLLGELKRRAEIPDDIPSDPEKMIEALPLWLALTVGKIPQIILVLDALNQIEGEPSHRNLSWLPRLFPDHVRVLASSLAGPALDALHTRDWATHQLPLTDATERGRMIDTFLKLYHKTLSSPQRNQIVNAPGAANPLFLRTVLEELRQFGDFDHLPDQIGKYLVATTPVELFQQVIQHWQKDFHGDRDIVNRSLRNLWAARQGLGESEWQDLLTDEDGPMDRQTWRPLLLAMEPHLVQHSSLWAFGHDFLRQAVVEELIPTDEKRQQAHLVLADYFELQLTGPRKAEELPWQLRQAGDRERLPRHLLDISLFRLIQARDQNELMGYWVWLGQERTMGQPYLEAFERWANTKGETVTVALHAYDLVGFLSFLGELYAGCEALIRHALAIFERQQGSNHPNATAALNDLAVLLSRTDQLTEAEQLYRRALLIDEQINGQNHPAVAIRLKNLAILLEKSNRVAEAEPLLRRALAIYAANYGENHPEFASSLRSLALLFYNTNRLPEAESMMQQALTINEGVFGKSHPAIADNLNDLGRLFQATHRPKEAELLYRNSWEIREQILGANSPSVSEVINNLATLYLETDQLAEAEHLMRRSLEINRRVYGKTHTMVANRLSNLAAVLRATNRTTEAEQLMRQALKIDEDKYGKSHPDVASDLNNLAQLLRATNRLTEAEPLMLRSLEIFLKFTRATGHQHPHLQAAMGNYGGLLRAMGRSGEEIEREMSDIGRHYGVDIGSTPEQRFTAMRQTAGELIKENRYAEAAKTLEQLLSAGFEIPGTHIHLARVCLLTDRPVEAREHAEQAWAHRSEAPPYTVARILWLQLLGVLQNREDPAPVLSKLKYLLQSGEATMEWSMDQVLAQVKSTLDSDSHAFLAALVAAMGDPEKIDALNSFPLWHDTPPQPPE